MTRMQFDRLLVEERARSTRYFDRMTTSASQLADIRRELGVSGKSQATTMAAIRGLRETITHLMSGVEKLWAEQAHERMFS